MEHFPEVLSIVAAAARGDSLTAGEYAKLLADKLEEEGAVKQAERLRRAVNGGPSEWLVVQGE